MRRAKDAAREACAARVKRAEEEAEEDARREIELAREEAQGRLDKARVRAVFHTQRGSTAVLRTSVLGGAAGLRVHGTLALLLSCH